MSEKNQQEQTLTDDSNHSILLIDDNPINLGVIADYLESYGFVVLVARDGQSGIQKAQYAQPDIILLDVMMPGIDGFETCRRLKQVPETAEIPVIFMTALTEVEHKVKGFEIGAVDYVTKPLNQREVLARINTHLKIRDLTRRLQQANRELKKISADKDKFFSIIAHDLKGPFQPLLNIAEMLTQTTTDWQAQHARTVGEALTVSVKNVYNLLENLLEWSRLQMGRMAYTPRRLNLTSIINRNIRLFSKPATDKQINLVSRVQEQVFVKADDYMLNTIIRNLISNALKFTHPSGYIIISAAIEGEAVAVSVTDTGIGMDESTVKKLFQVDQYQSTPGTAQEQGTGLGLIMCYEMVLLNQGDIIVDSTPDEGTTFCFTVPLFDAPPSSEGWLGPDPLAQLTPTERNAGRSAAMEMSDWVIPPLEEIEILYDLAMWGDVLGVGRRATQLMERDEQYVPFANKLSKLAADFEDEKIMTLLEQYRENPK